MIEDLIQRLAEVRAAGGDPTDLLLQLADALREAIKDRTEAGRAVVADILGREPMLATANVAELYSQGRVFAMTRAVDLAVTKRVQDLIAASAEEGTDATEVVARAGNFGRAYAETVVRTTMAQAESAGLREAMADPEVRVVAPALRFDAVRDADTRPNHAAADGLIADAADPIWKWATPPWGFKCRCSLTPVPREELAAAGLLKDGKVARFYPPTFHLAHPDIGFIPG